MGALGQVNAVVIDCLDARGLARFWAQVFDTQIQDASADGRYVDLTPSERSPVLRFQRVPEVKTIKNRLHLDVEVDDVPRAVEAVIGLGGSLVHPARVEYGWEYAVVADPEGNEFCVIRETG